MISQGHDLSTILYGMHEPDFPISQFEGLRVDTSENVEDDGQVTPNSILEHPLQYKNSSCSNDEMGSSHEPIVPKKKKGFLFSLGSRRKNAPHRAPLS